VLEGATAIAFEFIRAQMDRDTEKWEDRCAKNRENALRGRRKEAIASEPVRKEAIAADTDTDTVTDTETVEEINTPPTPSKGGKAKKVDPFVAFAGKIPVFSFVGTIRR
jgi:hypothetical protein